MRQPNGSYGIPSSTLYDHVNRKSQRCTNSPHRMRRERDSYGMSGVAGIWIFADDRYCRSNCQGLLNEHCQGKSIHRLNTWTRLVARLSEAMAGPPPVEA